MRYLTKYLLLVFIIKFLNNDEIKATIFGIVSNGNYWEFGKLDGAIFASNKDRYLLQDLDKLFAAVNYVFQQCEIQLNQLVTA